MWAFDGFGRLAFEYICFGRIEESSGDFRLQISETKDRAAIPDSRFQIPAMNARIGRRFQIADLRFEI
jgi:hypothetical protein